MLTLAQWQEDVKRTQKARKDRLWADRVMEVRSRQRGRQWRLDRVRGCLALIKQEAGNAYR